MTTAVPTVSDADAAVILARCDELARHSSLTDGIERTYLSAEHAAVNYRVAGWMAAAGLTTWQDAAGNQCARLSGSTRGLPALLLGSHLDTVRAAGRYDGILGVLVAITVAGRIAASGRPLPFALEIAAFGDEEGTRFGTTLLGSRAVAGTWLDSWWDLRDADGTSLREAFLAFGLDPARVGDAAVVADEDDRPRVVTPQRDEQRERRRRRRVVAAGIDLVQRRPAQADAGVERRGAEADRRVATRSKIVHGMF